MEKTSPVQGDVFFTGDVRTHGHCDSMTESAQWADSVKMGLMLVFHIHNGHEGFLSLGWYVVVTKQSKSSSENPYILEQRTSFAPETCESSEQMICGDHIEGKTHLLNCLFNLIHCEWRKSQIVADGIYP